MFDTGTVTYNVRLSSDAQFDRKKEKSNEISSAGPFQDQLKAAVTLVDKRNNVVATGSGFQGVLTLNNPKLWWPFSMVANDSEAGHLYTLVVSVNT
jgi:beta-galactosidase/beta-glucuronidase